MSQKLIAIEWFFKSELKEIFEIFKALYKQWI